MNIDRRVGPLLILGASIGWAALAGGKFIWAEDGAAPAPTDTKTNSKEAIANTPAKETPEGMTGEETAVEKAPAKAAAPAKGRGRIDQADSFVATPDWEFDGFIAGGKGQSYRSIFYLND